MEAARSLDAWVAPVDHLRAILLRATGPLGRRLVADREVRVAANASVGIGVAGLTTALVPMWMLALGPLVLGVPHLVADLRYLVLRDGLHRRLPFVVACGGPILAFGVGAAPAVGLVAVVGAAAIADGTRARRALVAGLGLAAIGLALAAPFWTSLGLAHLHNLIGIAAWWAWRSRRTAAHLVPIALFGVGFVALLGGALDGWTPDVPLPGGLSPEAHARWLAPRIAEPWAGRIVLSFAFAQQIHYSVWLRLVPDDARRRPTPRTLRRTLHDTLDDVGPALLGAAAITSVVLLAWAFVDVVHARNAYLHLAKFHGVLELAVLALWAIEGRPAPGR